MISFHFEHNPHNFVFSFTKRLHANGDNCPQLYTTYFPSSLANVGLLSYSNQCYPHKPIDPFNILCAYSQTSSNNFQEVTPKIELLQAEHI